MEIKDLVEKNQNKFNLFNGIECGNGWYNLIKKIVDHINEDNKILQIKEKLGGLRVRLSNYNDELWNLIHMVEEESYITCELCGQVGKVNKKSGYIKVRCVKCLEKEEN